MIPKEIIDQLIFITDEKRCYQQGIKTVDTSIYTNETSDVVDYNKLLSSNQQLAVYRHPCFLHYPKHRHNYIELSYVYRGSMVHIIDDEEIVIEQGEIILLNQDIEHEIKPTEETDIILNFIIHPNFLDFLITIGGEKNEIFKFIFHALYSSDNYGECLIFKVSKNDAIKDIIESIITKLYQPALSNSVTLKLYIGMLLVELANHPQQMISYRKDSYEKMINGSILNYIRIHYKEGSLQELSQLIKQPNYKICKIVKKYTGQTFNQLIQEERLKNSAKLLETTMVPITDVIGSVGYENATYFYKIFKNKYKQSPKEYRKINNTLSCI